MSTVKPPLTLPEIRPVMASLFSNAPSSSSQTSARLAFSRDSLVSPKPSSIASSATLTSSPILISRVPSSSRNCSIGTMPSDFSPALITTTSERMSTTMPDTMDPGFSLEIDWLCSNSSAKLSFIKFPVGERTVLPATFIRLGSRQNDPPVGGVFTPLMGFLQFWTNPSGICQSTPIPALSGIGFVNQTHEAEHVRLGERAHSAIVHDCKDQEAVVHDRTR